MDAGHRTAAALPRGAAAVVLLLGVLTLLGCTPAAESDVYATAQAFQSAVQGDDEAAACAALSDEARSALELTSSQPCARALAVLDLPSRQPTAVQVWGDNGQARLASGVLFLAKFPDGWKVTAAGCHSRPKQPYACAVRG